MRLRRSVVAATVLTAVLIGTQACGPGAEQEPANPLAGASLWIDPESAAARAEQQLRDTGDSATADGLSPISSQPVATWLVDDDPTAATRRVTQTAAVTGQLPVLVLYHRPGRDCGSYSAGGAAEQSSYLSLGRRGRRRHRRPAGSGGGRTGRHPPGSERAVRAGRRPDGHVRDARRGGRPAGRAREHPGLPGRRPSGLDRRHRRPGPGAAGQRRRTSRRLQPERLELRLDRRQPGVRGRAVVGSRRSSSTSSTSPATAGARPPRTRAASTPGATHRAWPWARTRGSAPTGREPSASCGSRSREPPTATAARANPRPGSSGPRTPSG